MRCFVGIDLDKEAKEEFINIQNEIKKTHLIEGKYVDKDLAHLTLKFLGEIDEKLVEEVKKALKKVKLNKFEAELDKLGVFTPSFIKIVWISLKNCEKLQQAVDKALTGLFPAEDRFMSHITVARVKNVKDKKEFLEKIKKIKFEKKKMLVDKFYLMESVLHEEGPEYKIIEEYTLL